MPAPPGPRMEEVVEAHLAEEANLVKSIPGLDMDVFGCRVQAHALAALETDSQDLFAAFLADADRANETENETTGAGSENHKPPSASPSCRGRIGCVAEEEEAQRPDEEDGPMGVSPQNVVTLSFNQVLQGKDANAKGKRGAGSGTGPGTPRE